MTTSARFGIFLLPDFQEVEFWYPVLRLREEKHSVSVIGLQADEAAVLSRLGYPVIPEVGLAEGLDGFDVLVVPGTFSESAPRPALEQALAQAHARGATVAASGTSTAMLERAGLLPASGAAGERVLLSADADAMPEFAKALLALAR